MGKSVTKGRGAATDLDIDIDAEIAVVDARHTEARGAEPGSETSEPSDELVEAAFRLSLVEPRGDWASDPTQAKVAYFHHAPDLEDALRSYSPHLVEVSTRFGYVTWPRRIRRHIEGRRVLDVGCGNGCFGMGFLVAGATSYVGVDPALDLDSPRARDKRARTWDSMGVTPREITATLPALQLIRGKVEEQELDGPYDALTLHNLTEHVADLDDVLAALPTLCHADSTLLLLHHNFYSWSGHKRGPANPAQLDDTDPGHQLVSDWRHINAVPDLPDDHPIMTNLNRIRLADLRTAIERHFDVVEWEEAPSPEAVLARLTPEIVERVRETVPDITEHELTVNTVLVVARPKA